MLYVARFAVLRDQSGDLLSRVTRPQTTFIRWRITTPLFQFIPLQRVKSDPLPPHPVMAFFLTKRIPKMTASMPLKSGPSCSIIFSSFIAGSKQFFSQMVLRSDAFLIGQGLALKKNFKTIRLSPPFTQIQRSFIHKEVKTKGMNVSALGINPKPKSQVLIFINFSICIQNAEDPFSSHIERTR